MRLTATRTRNQLSSCTAGWPAAQVATGQPYTLKSDVWSLGCVLYELATLRHAFAADNLLSLVFQIAHATPQPLPPERYSSELQGLVDALLQKDPAQRPSLQQVCCALVLGAGCAPGCAARGLEGCCCPLASRALTTPRGVPTTTPWLQLQVLSLPYVQEHMHRFNQQERQRVLHHTASLALRSSSMAAGALPARRAHLDVGSLEGSCGSVRRGP